MTDNNEILEKLILAGAVEVAGLDPSGEFLYSFTPQMPELFPEFYEHVSYHYSAAITDLWTNGYLEITLDENGDEIVTLNEKSTDPAELEKLDIPGRTLMDAILRSFEIES